MEVLENFGLREIDIYDLFFLQPDLKPIDVCKERTWDLASGDLYYQLKDRWAHVVGAMADRRDEVGQKLANNAITYIRMSPELHWDCLLSMSKRNRTISRRWPCCSGDAVMRKETEDGVGSSPVLDHPHKAKPLATQCSPLEPSLPTRNSDEQRAPANVTKRINAARNTYICTCHQAFDTLWSLVCHAHSCLHVHSSARAKSGPLRTRADTCIYSGCLSKFSNSSKHEQCPHYICCCGKIGVMGSSHMLSCWTTCRIDPLSYFLHPPKDERPNLQSILEKMLVHQPECFLRALAQLDGPSLLSMARTTLTALTDPRSKKERKRAASVDIEEQVTMFAWKSPTATNVNETAEGINGRAARDVDGISSGHGAQKADHSDLSQEPVCNSQIEIGGCSPNSPSIEQRNSTTYLAARATKRPKHDRSVAVSNDASHLASGKQTAISQYDQGLTPPYEERQLGIKEYYHRLSSKASLENSTNISATPACPAGAEEPYAQMVAAEPKGKNNQMELAIPRHDAPYFSHSCETSTINSGISSRKETFHASGVSPGNTSMITLGPATALSTNDSTPSAGNTTTREMDSVPDVAGKTCDYNYSNVEISLHECIKPRMPSDAHGLRIKASDLQKWLENAANVIDCVYFGSPGGIKPFLSILAIDFVETPPGESISLPPPGDMRPAQQIYRIETDTFRDLIKEGGYDCGVWCYSPEHKLVTISITLEDKDGRANSLADKFSKIGEQQGL